MFQPIHWIRLFTLVLFVALLLPGCGRRHQLERVAKDWCETIRASQVIAVYPLTEDIQPGDIFLVQTPIDKQQDIYREKGFLPLDNHLARLDPRGFGRFYDHTFLRKPPDDSVTLPKDWMAAKWESAPTAAFPSYAFSVDRSGGLNLAIPVSGVPVGLSLLGARSANGSITLKDARTIGVDTESLYNQVKRWAEANEDRQAFIANYGVFPEQEPRNYLRVITRVYLLGEIDVQLNSASSFSSGLDVGAGRPVDLFLADPPQGTDDVQRSSRENFMRGVQRMNNLNAGGRDFADPTDASLSAEELAAREAKRKELRAAELKSASDAVTAAKEAQNMAIEKAETSDEGKNLKTAKETTKQKREAVEAKEEALEQARSSDKSEQLKKELKELEEADTPDQAKIDAKKAEIEAEKKKLEKAEGELAQAKEDLAEAEKDQVKKQAAFDAKHARDLDNAATEVKYKNSALAALQDFAPGGSFRFTAASSRSVSLNETFDRPLVVGYLGFDIPIGVFGELGSPIPTHAILDKSSYNAAKNPSAREGIYKRIAISSLYGDLKEKVVKGDSFSRRTKQELDKMARFIPIQCPQLNVYTTPDGKKHRTLSFVDLNNEDFDSYLVFRGKRNAFINGLHTLPKDQNVYRIKDVIDWQRKQEAIKKKKDAGEDVEDIPHPDPIETPRKLAERMNPSKEEQREYDLAYRYLNQAVFR